jgi:hypothetical protein
MGHQRFSSFGPRAAGQQIDQLAAADGGDFNVEDNEPQAHGILA